MGILEKISEIEKEIARTQKNKGITSFQIEMSYTALNENMP
jgi:ribosome-interacting GTPase 1